MSYFYVFMTVVLTAYNQITIKWQVLKADAPAEALPDKISFLFHLLLNPWIISAFVAAFLPRCSGLCR